jgi:hypothetical protein
MDCSLPISQEINFLVTYHQNKIALLPSLWQEYR